MRRRRRYIGEGGITEGLSRRLDGVGQPLRLNTGIWWWVWGKIVKNGRMTRVLRGPYSSEEEAFEAGSSLLGSEFECVPLKTRDTAQASRIMRNKVAEETKDVETTFRKFRHKFLADRKTPATQEGNKSAWGGSED